MLDECERLDKAYAERKIHTHIHTPEEIVPAKYPNDATLSNEMNNKTARRLCPKKGRTKQIQKIVYNEVNSGGDFPAVTVFYTSVDWENHHYD